MIPTALQTNPSLDRWVAFTPDGRVQIGFGKVEYGQGVMTALAQIGAEELGVAFRRVDVAPLSTENAPDEGMTVGSMSIESSGPAVRAACAEVRNLFLTEMAKQLSCSADELEIDDGAFLKGGKRTGKTYWSLAEAVPLARAAMGEAQTRPIAAYQTVGTNVPRLDLGPKIFGAAFLHDMRMDSMLHARVLRKPSPKARLVAIDEAAIRRAARDDIEIIRVGDFVAFLSDREPSAMAALVAAERHTTWEGARALASDLSEASSLPTMPSTDHSEGAPPPPASNRRRHNATYSRPYIAHGSIGPSCSIAKFEDRRLTVWTHAQHVYPLRAWLSRVTGLEPSAITVHHAQGAGCYGHNGSDDASFDAATIALRVPGRPIRVQWRREDEFAHEPVGTAMQISLSAELDDEGSIADLSTEIWSGPHVGRGRSLVEAALPRTKEPEPGTVPNPLAMLARFSGGRLNAIPSYDLPATRVTEHVVHPMPVRTSSLRGLGGPVNTFAGECFVDELAEIAQQDPLAYRLGMTKDPRGRRVLERVAEMANWNARGPSGSGAGLGLGYDRHRDRGAYVAVAVALEADEDVRLTKMWCAADCGLIINPDGAKNQIEGGMIMAASWALKEQVQLEGEGIASRSWSAYPILRFDEVPPVEIDLVNVHEMPSFGAGEISSGPAMAAIGNALAHALGARVRDLPFTRERIAQALLAR
jgi:CO/xanthine dehydrogenase Mo-binding subunit